ncbi:hypothetical protein U1Q18_000734 [Sarracenia purpurea var. burkii]
MGLVPSVQWKASPDPQLRSSPRGSIEVGSRRPLLVFQRSWRKAATSLPVIFQRTIGVRSSPSVVGKPTLAGFGDWRSKSKPTRAGLSTTEGDERTPVVLWKITGREVATLR